MSVHVTGTHMIDQTITKASSRLYILRVCKVSDIYLFNHFHHNRGCGGGCTTEWGSKLSAPFYPPNHDIPQKTDHNTGNYMPYSLQQVWGFFDVPQEYEHWRVVRRGLWFIVLIRED